MELIECIKKRRSVRQYIDREVSWDLISEVLDSGRYAPKSGGLQNIRFVVIRNKAKRKEIARISFDQDWMMHAPAYIVVCSDDSKIKRLYSERGEKLYSIQNSSAAIQNMLLRAYDLGLATCWVGAFDEHELSLCLALPPHIRPHAIITLGYTKKQPKSPEQDPLDVITYFEEYGKKLREEVGKKPIEKPLDQALEKVKGILSKIKK